MRRFPITRSALAAALALAALGASPAAAQSPPAEQRIAANVVAGGVDLSGLTASEAKAKLKAELVPRLSRDVTVRAAGRRFTFAGATAKAKLNLTRTVEAALAVTVQPAAPQAGGVPVGASVVPVVTHAKIPVRTFADGVAAAVLRRGRDASVRIGIRKMTLRRAKLGIGLDAAALAAKIDAAIDDPAAPRTVTQRVRKVYPAVNADDLRAQYRTVVTVDRASFTLRLFKDLRLRKTYKVAVGQPAYPTPTGRFTIANKQVDPVWSVPNSPWAGELAGTTVAGGSAANPLKARWMGIANGVGIHGTGQEWSIGSRASHGCIRMRVSDVKDLYPRVPVGATVLIR
jgi:lipoprotein-anchoring transpeptidase ErfK/SrfK